MACVGGIRGAGVFASFPDLGVAYPNLLRSRLSAVACEVVWLEGFMDGGLDPGESPARLCRCR
jgi:hypothetical protein